MSIVFSVTGCCTPNLTMSFYSWPVASVFLHANRCSSSYIVYPYFVLVVIIAVCIMLNLIVAFFVESKFPSVLTKLYYTS